jgi:hypothetical protein
MEEQQSEPPSRELYEAVLPRVQRRGRVVMALAAGIVLLVAVRGVVLWSALPGEVPVRWNTGGGERQGFSFISPGFQWSSTNPVHWVDKTIFAIFGQLLMSLLFLAIGWVFIRTRFPRNLMVRLRRYLLGSITWLGGAFEAAFYDELVAWLVSGVSVAMAWDSLEMWSLALGHRAPGAHALVDITVIVMFLGLGAGIRQTWLYLRRLEPGPSEI